MESHCFNPLHSNRLTRIHETKYLGYLLSEDDITKQMGTLYIRLNKLLQMF